MAAPKDLKAHAIELLNIWCNEKDIGKGIPYLHPSVTQIHDDEPPIQGADTFVARWKEFLKFVPDFKMDIKDVIQEGNRVWIFSRISGLPDGVVKDSVDMTVFDEDGKLLHTKDVQRVVEE